MTTPLLQLRGVGIRYGDTEVVADASFDVAQGEFVTLLGPSGSGKTSLLRAIAGFVKTSAGDILIEGERVNDTPAYERDVGLVFQNYALFPHMTVAENLGFGPRMLRVPRQEIETRVEETLAHVRLSPYAARYPHELSGGQQQRVAIARALAIRPRLMLLDEPMSNLDAKLRAEMRVELTALLRRLGVTAVSVTHNQEEALAMSDQVVVMGEGGVRQIGTPGDVYLRPADPFVAGFVGDANVVEATHLGYEDVWHFYQSPWGRVACKDAPPGVSGNSMLLLRPEAISLVRAGTASSPAPRDDEHCTRGEFVARAYMGAFVELRATIGTTEILVKLPAASAPVSLSVGDIVELRWDVASVRAIKS